MYLQGVKRLIGAKVPAPAGRAPAGGPAAAGRRRDILSEGGVERG